MIIFYSDNVTPSMLTLTPEESAHCVRVLRHRVGDDICVVDGNHLPKEVKDVPETTSAALFDLNHCDVLYAKDVFTQVYPASLTKVMTALVALESASLDTVLTASSNVYMSDASAQKAGLEEGDTMTLDQALHLLLIQARQPLRSDRISSLHPLLP